MPISIWILLVPAVVLLLCGLFTFRRRRRWPSFTVGFIVCDAFFLVCMMMVNLQLSLLAQATADSLTSSVFPLPVKRIAGVIVRGTLNARACAEAYSLLQTIMVIFLVCTVVSLVWECYRIFSAPPELLAAQKKLSEQEERLHRRIPRTPLRTKERKPDADERKNKL